MPRLRTIPRAAWLALVVILLIGGGLRWDQSRNPVQRISADAQSYSSIAQHIAETGNYSGRSGRKKALHWPPATPQIFAAAYRASPGDRPTGTTDYDPVYNAQFVISTATIPAAFLLGWLLLGPWTGVLAALVVGLYPPLVWGPSTMLSEPLGALFVTLAFAALTAAWRSRRPAFFGLAGALFGAVALTRTDLLFVPFFLAAMAFVVLLVQRGRRPALLSSAAMLGTFAVVVVPWVVQASDTAGKFVPVTSGGASAQFVGTYLPGNGSTFDMKFALRDEVVRRHPTFATRPYTLIPAGVVLDDVAARYPGLTRDEALGRATKDNIRRYALREPVAFGQMMLFKGVKMWSRYARGGANKTSVAWTTIHDAIVLLAAFGLLWGVVRLRDPALGAILLGLLLATGVHTLAVAHGRYNLPLMPILIAGGAAGWGALLRARRTSTAPEAVGEAGPVAPAGPSPAPRPPRTDRPHPAV